MYIFTEYHQKMYNNDMEQIAIEDIQIFICVQIVEAINFTCHISSIGLTKKYIEAVLWLVLNG